MSSLLTNREVFLHTIRLTFIATLTNRDKPVRLVAPTMDKAFPGPQRALRDPTSPIPSTFQRGTIIGLGWVGRSWDARAIAWQEKMHLKNKYKKKGSSHSLHARYGLCDSRWVLRSKSRLNFCFSFLLISFSLSLLSSLSFFCSVISSFLLNFLLFVTLSIILLDWWNNMVHEFINYKYLYSLEFCAMSLSRWKIFVKEIYSCLHWIKKKIRKYALSIIHALRTSISFTNSRFL